MEKPPLAIPQRLEKRKTPIQARSGATVDAIHEAVIQVLLADGLSRLTTTRVAARAGVSVGTLYQYFPNKEALLFAVLRMHFEQLAESFDRIPIGAPQSLHSLSDKIADAYVEVKLANPQATTALYRVAGAIDQVRLSGDILQRLEGAVARALTSASDATFTNPKQTAFTLLSALAGLSRGSFGRASTEPRILDHLRCEARLISRAYLAIAATASGTM